MRTVPLAKLLSSMQPGTVLMGICFTPRSLRAAVTTCHIRQQYPTDVPPAAAADPDSLLRVVKELQVLSNWAKCFVQLSVQQGVTRPCADRGANVRRFCLVSYEWFDTIWR